MAKTKKLAFGGMGGMLPKPVTNNPKKISIPNGITPTNAQQNPQQMGRPLGGATQPVPRYGTPIQMSPRGGPMNPGRGLPNAVGQRERLLPPKPGFKSDGPGFAPLGGATIFDLAKSVPQSVIDNFRNSVKNPQVGGGTAPQNIVKDAPQSVIDNFRNSVKNPQVGGMAPMGPGTQTGGPAPMGMAPPNAAQVGMFKKGGAVKAKAFAKGGAVKTTSMGSVKTTKPKMGSASSRGDGIAQRGKTKGRMV